MISFFLVALAAVLCALMDKVDEHFHISIFKNLNPKFWSKAVSSEWAKKIFEYKIDAWHLAKSLMIISLCLAIVLYKPCAGKLWDFIIMGAIWNIWFNLFYNKVFSSK